MVDSIIVQRTWTARFTFVLREIGQVIANPVIFVLVGFVISPNRGYVYFQFAVEWPDINRVPTWRDSYPGFLFNSVDIGRNWLICIIDLK